MNLELIPVKTGNRFITECVYNDKLPAILETCLQTLVEVVHRDKKNEIYMVQYAIFQHFDQKLQKT